MCYNYIFTSSCNINKPVFIHARHISRVKPAVFYDFVRRFRIFIVAEHNAWAMDNEFAHISLCNFPALLVYNLCFPVIARFPDGSHFMYILHAQMYTAGTYGFTQPIVGVIQMMWEMFFPALDQTGRNRLGSDVHQPPLLQQIMLHIHFPGIDGVQKILRPWHQKPHNGTLFLRDRPQNPLRFHAPQQHRLAARNQRTEPVHFRPGVIEGRNTEEYILPFLSVVVLLRLAGGAERLVIM